MVSALTSTDVLRPAGPAWKQRLFRLFMGIIPPGFRLLRRFLPFFPFGKMVVVTRYDDVMQVFGDDQAFAAPYKAKLDVIMGGQPFFLGMEDTPAYRADTAALRQAIRREDLPALGARVEALAGRIVAASGGRVDVVDTLVRAVTFGVLGDYFGVPEPPGADLRVWATRLFEFQFVDGTDNPDLRRDVDEIAPALRAHIQGEIARRRQSLGDRDDVLGRCLILQDQRVPGFDDDHIRTFLMGVFVGGPPQPPMVVPQAMEQLLRRPACLAAAAAAARAGDDDVLRGYVLEAMRFDPLAPGMPRTVTHDTVLAAGTRRARKVAAGTSILAASASAMMDDRRVADPYRFDPRRPSNAYIHFGHGLHTCFGKYINEATLHLMLKPLLQQPNLRRASGREGHLSKRGVFAERLVVEFG